MKKLLFIVLILLMVPFVFGEQTLTSDRDHNNIDCINSCISKRFEENCRSIIDGEEYGKCKYAIYDDCNKKCGVIGDDCELACKHRVLSAATEIEDEDCLKECYGRNVDDKIINIKTEEDLYAYWQCYDGFEGKQAVRCGSSNTWDKYAKESCSGHCNDGSGKCGVNTFIVFG